MADPKKYSRTAPLPKSQVEFMELLIKFEGQWIKAPRAVDGRALLALLRRGLIERSPNTQHLDYNKGKYRVLNKTMYETLKLGSLRFRY